MMTKIALGAVALLAMAGEARATFMDGNRLYEDCTGAVNFGEGVCLGYILGVVDQWESVRLVQNEPRCVPDGVKARQVNDVVVNYLRDHPENRSYAALSLVTVAVSKAWNCQ
jgi:hypothetical protein